MEKNEENINPDSWTEKELLKHLYRTVKEMQIEQFEMKKELVEIKLEITKLEIKFTTLQTEVHTREKDIDRRISRNSTIAYVVGVIIAGAAFILGYTKG